MNALFLCLGGNMGNRAALLKQALAQIDNLIGTIECKSSVYESEAWGHSSERGYYNMVVKVITTLSPEAALKICLSIEQELGRIRSSKGYHDRTMDIDIILFGDLIRTEPTLILPHPRFHLRKFVLLPLHEIAANLQEPVSRKTIAQLLENCEDASTIVNIGSLY